MRMLKVSEKAGLNGYVLITRFFFPPFYKTVKSMGLSKSRQKHSFISWLKNTVRDDCFKNPPRMHFFLFNSAFFQGEWSFDIKIKIAGEESILNPTDESNQQYFRLKIFWLTLFKMHLHWKQGSIVSTRENIITFYIWEKIEVGIHPHDWHILQQAIPLKALALV